MTAVDRYGFDIAATTPKGRAPRASRSDGPGRRTPDDVRRVLVDLAKRARAAPR